MDAVDVLALISISLVVVVCKAAVELKTRNLIIAALEEAIEQLPRHQPQLSETDIIELIKFCHPDRNSGNRKAVEITAKLLELRRKQ